MNDPTQQSQPSQDGQGVNIGGFMVGGANSGKWADQIPAQSSNSETQDSPVGISQQQADYLSKIQSLGANGVAEANKQLFQMLNPSSVIKNQMQNLNLQSKQFGLDHQATNQGYRDQSAAFNQDTRSIQYDNKNNYIGSKGNVVGPNGQLIPSRGYAQNYLNQSQSNNINGQNSAQNIGRYTPSTQFQQQGQVPQQQSFSPHQQALDWAKANPNDPRSSTILKMNGL